MNTLNIMILIALITLLVIHVAVAVFTAGSVNVLTIGFVLKIIGLIAIVVIGRKLTN